MMTSYKVVSKGLVTIIIARSWIDCIKRARKHFGHNFFYIMN